MPNRFAVWWEKLDEVEIHHRRLKTLVSIAVPVLVLLALAFGFLRELSPLGVVVSLLAGALLLVLLAERLSRFFGWRLSDETGNADAAAGPVICDALILDRPRIDFTELFERTDAAFKITFNIKNVSGIAVELTDLAGEIALNGQDMGSETCRAPRRFGRPLRLGRGDYRSIEIVQPVSGDLRDKMTSVLYSEARWLQFGFGGLTFEGTVERPSGTEPLRDCYFRAEPLYVRGPVRDRDAATRVQAWSSVFADAKTYNNVGISVEGSERTT